MVGDVLEEAPANLGLRVWDLPGPPEEIVPRFPDGLAGGVVVPERMARLGPDEEEHRVAATIPHSAGLRPGEGSLSDLRCLLCAPLREAEAGECGEVPQAKIGVRRREVLERDRLR